MISIRKAGAAALASTLLLVLPSTALPGGVVFAEHLRTIIAERPCVFENLSIAFTISVGVTTLHRETGVDPAALIKRADENLYVAKRGGHWMIVSPIVRDSIAVLGH